MTVRNDAELLHFRSCIDVPHFSHKRSVTPADVVLDGVLLERDDDPAPFALARVHGDVEDAALANRPVSEEDPEAEIPERECAARGADDEPDVLAVDGEAGDRAEVARVRELVQAPHRTHV